jgi:hypothetical protein
VLMQQCLAIKVISELHGEFCPPDGNPRCNALLGDLFCVLTIRILRNVSSTAKSVAACGEKETAADPEKLISGNHSICSVSLRRP